MRAIRCFPALLALSFSGGLETSPPAKVLGNPRYAIDSLNRLRSIRHEDGATRWVARDLAGRDHAETTISLVGGLASFRVFQNDGYRRIGSNGAGSARRFLFGRSLDELLFQEQSGEPFSPVVSQLGSTMKLLGGAGTIADQFRYDAYGAPLAGNTKDFSHLFAGAIYDSTSKRYDLRNRYYDPKIGRFLSRDPLGMHADGFNTGNAYAYVGNNPLNRRDPLGLSTEEPGFFDTLGFAWNLAWGMTDRKVRSEAAEVKADVLATMDEYNVPERLEGGLTMLGGAGWTVFGAGLTGLGIVGEVPSGGSSTIAVVGGSAIAVDGLDMTQAGARQLWTGEIVTPYLEQAAIAGLQQAGMSESNATTLVQSTHGAVMAGATLGASTITQGPRLAFAGGATLPATASANALHVATAGVAVTRTAAGMVSGPSLMTGGDNQEGPGPPKDCDDKAGWEKFERWAHGGSKRATKQTHKLASQTASKFRKLSAVVGEADQAGKPISFEWRETLRAMAERCIPIFDELRHAKLNKVTLGLDRCAEIDAVLGENLVRLKKFLGEFKGP